MKSHFLTKGHGCPAHALTVAALSKSHARLSSAFLIIPKLFTKLMADQMRQMAVAGAKSD
jgi:hypothetical protein